MNVSEAILSSSVYLSLGIIIYYLLSLVIVHIKSVVELEVFNNKVPITHPFKKYPNWLLEDMKVRKLHCETFKYINPFRKRKNTYLTEEITKGWITTKWIRVLKTYISFIKPFIICSIIFTIFAHFIEANMPENKNTEFFEVIQEALWKVDNYPLWKSIYANKIYINLAIGLLILLIPILFNLRRKIKPIRRYFNQFIIYIAVLTNVTFFTGQLSKKANDTKYELANLAINIEKIHLNIYSKVLSKTFNDDNRKAFEKNVNEYFKLLEKVKEKRRVQLNKIEDADYEIEFDRITQKFVKSLELNDVSFPKPLETNPLGYLRTEFKKVQKYKHTESTTGKVSEVEYLFNDIKWTIENGLELDIKVDAHILESYSPSDLNNYTSSSKVRFMFNELLTATSKLGIQALEEYLPILGQDFLKKTLQIIISFNEKFIFQRFNQFFKNPKDRKTVSLPEGHVPTQSVESIYNSLTRPIILKNKNLKKSINELKQEIRLRIETKVNAALYEYVQSLTYQDYLDSSADFKKSKETWIANRERYLNGTRIKQDAKKYINQIYRIEVYSENRKNLVRYQKKLQTTMGKPFNISPPIFAKMKNTTRESCFCF